MVDGTTYLPVRAVASALGLAVEWDGETNTVRLGETGLSGEWSENNPAPFGTKITVDWFGEGTSNFDAKYTTQIRELLRGEAAYAELSKRIDTTRKKTQLDSMLGPGKEFLIFRVGIDVDSMSRSAVQISIASFHRLGDVVSGFGKRVNQPANLRAFLPLRSEH
jgi:hypothetical protein